MHYHTSKKTVASLLFFPIPGTCTAEHHAENLKASDIVLTAEDMSNIENILPAGFAHGNRYAIERQGSAEHYC
jgi:diketogulonate reductase-like aldo/keto reductase